MDVVNLDSLRKTWSQQADHGMDVAVISEPHVSAKDVKEWELAARNAGCRLCAARSWSSLRPHIALAESLIT